MTLRETVGLRKIRRERFAIWFWVLSYLPVVLIVRGVTHSHQIDGPITFIWIVALLATLSRVIFSRCPHCGGRFFSTDKSARVRYLFTGKCMQCGQPLKAERVMYPSLE
jgi:DNA-directed RNA polymerase subunit RPC12/RpoP